MNNEILFYVFGIALAVSAVLVSIAGLRMKDFPGKAFPVVVLWFAILVGGAATFAVLHSQDEKADHEVEYVKAGEEIEKETSSGPYETSGSEESEGEGGRRRRRGSRRRTGSGRRRPGGAVELAAAEAEPRIRHDRTEQQAGQGEIEFDNPSAIPHNVEVEDESGKVLGGTETIASSEESATVELGPAPTPSSARAGASRSGMESEEGADPAGHATVAGGMPLSPESSPQTKWKTSRPTSHAIVEPRNPGAAGILSIP